MITRMILLIFMSTKNEKTIIEIKDIIKLLVAAAKIIDKVTSLGDKGAYSISTIFPCIFPIIIEDEEWEKACCIICIQISPGARKVIKGTPKTSPLSFPIASDKTSKNNSAEIRGENNVCIHTTKKRNTSFLYKVKKPIQFIRPNLVSLNLYLWLKLFIKYF